MLLLYIIIKTKSIAAGTVKKYFQRLYSTNIIKTENIKSEKAFTKTCILFYL